VARIENRARLTDHGDQELRAAVQHYRAFGGRLADFTSAI